MDITETFALLKLITLKSNALKLVIIIGISCTDNVMNTMSLLEMIGQSPQP